MSFKAKGVKKWNSHGESLADVALRLNAGASWVELWDEADDFVELDYESDDRDDVLHDLTVHLEKLVDEAGRLVKNRLGKY